MARPRLLLLLGGLTLIVVLGILSTARMLRGPNAIAVASESRQQLRAAADSCQQELSAGESRLHAFRGRLDSMRGRVAELEGLDPQGVPADSYAIYMRAFEQYNDSAGSWEARVDTLQQQLGRCRAIVEAHNVAADSLRRLLQERRR